MPPGIVIAGQGSIVIEGNNSITNQFLSRRTFRYGGTLPMPVHELRNTTTTEDVVEVLKEDGVVIVQNLVDSSLVDAIHVELQPFLESTTFGRDDFAGFLTKRTGSLIARSQSFHQLALHPLILDTAAKVLGPYC